MKVLFLSPYRPEFIDYLTVCGDQSQTTEEKLSFDSECLDEVDFIVSYGYRHIIKKDILDKFNEKAINIHISFLPWNRGADPNLWSFLENTPKGVTIHYLDEGIDTGDILVQKKVHFATNETLRSSYEKLSQIALDLFKQSWLEIREGKIEAVPQKQQGSYHRLDDKKNYEHLLTQGWDTPVSNLIGKAL